MRISDWSSDVCSSDRAVTNAFVVPTMLARIVDAMEKGVTVNTASLRAIAYGGGKMPLEVIHEALERFPGAGFTNAYGLTETSSTVALLGPDDPREAPIGRAACRERVCQYVKLSGVAEHVKKKNIN